MEKLTLADEVDRSITREGYLKLIEAYERERAELEGKLARLRELVAMTGASPIERRTAKDKLLAVFHDGKEHTAKELLSFVPRTQLAPTLSRMLEAGLLKRGRRGVYQERKA